MSQITAEEEAALDHSTKTAAMLVERAVEEAERINADGPKAWAVTCLGEAFVGAMLAQAEGEIDAKRLQNSVATALRYIADFAASQTGIDVGLVITQAMEPSKLPPGTSDMDAIYEPLSASMISVQFCEHGTIYVRLHEPSGRIFAIASMPPDTADRVQTDLMAAVCAVRPAGAKKKAGMN